MTRGVRWALLALALSACRRPPPEDPNEAAYRRAIELFAKVSAETHDLSYRDPRFDEVLSELAEVPVGDELRPKADLLASQIRAARAESARAEGESDQALSRALADPPFVPLPKDAPFPARAVGSGPASNSDSSSPAGSGWGSAGAKGTSHLVRGPNNTLLPDWYQKAGYLGLGKHPPAAAPPAGSSGAEPTVDPAAEAPPPASAQVRSVAPSQAPTDQPPPVYGLPGPAGHALLGHP